MLSEVARALFFLYFTDSKVNFFFFFGFLFSAFNIFETGMLLVFDDTFKV